MSFLKRIRFSTYGLAMGIGAMAASIAINLNPVLYSAKKNMLLIFLVALFFSGICIFYGNNPFFQKYRTKGRFAALCCIAIYASFASWGQRLFHMDAQRMYTSLSDIFYLLVGAVWFLPVLTSLLAGMEWLCVARLRPVELVRPPRWKVQLGLLLLFLSVQCVFLYSFWPGGYGNDGVYLMPQIAGDEQLNDWHPAFYLLTQRFLWNLAGHHVAIFPAVQLGLFAVLMTEYLMIGYDNGIRPRTLAILGTVFLILPNQAMSLIGVVKDIPFTLAMLWCSVLLYRLMINSDSWLKPSWLIAMVVSLFMMMAYRHNGIVPAIITGIVLIVIAFRHPRDVQRSHQVRIRLICVPVIAMVMLGVLKGPVFTYYRVIPNTSSTYVSMLCAVGSCVNKDLPLSDETNEILEEVMPLEDWKDFYSRYQGHDIYMWSSRNGFNTSTITASKAFKIYLEALFKYPDVVIKDRLDGMDILWNIQQPPEAFNMRYFDGIYPAPFLDRYFDMTGMEDIGFNSITHRGISDIFRKIANFGADTFPDSLLWRTGAYIVFLLLLFLFWKVHHVNVLLPGVPFFANLFASLLVVYFQAFRYVYFIQLYVVVLTFITIAHLRAEGR